MCRTNKIFFFGLKNVRYKLLWIAIDERKPGALYLNHHSMAWAKCVHDIAQRKSDSSRLAGCIGTGFSKLSRKRPRSTPARTSSCRPLSTGRRAIRCTCCHRSVRLDTHRYFDDPVASLLVLVTHRSTSIGPAIVCGSFNSGRDKLDIWSPGSKTLIFRDVSLAPIA